MCAENRLCRSEKKSACFTVRHDNFAFYKRNKNIIKDEFEMIRKDDMDPPMVSFMPEMSHTSNILLQEQQVCGRKLSLLRKIRALCFEIGLISA